MGRSSRLKRSHLVSQSEPAFVWFTQFRFQNVFLIPEPKAQVCTILGRGNGNVLYYKAFS
jgi:hypothetical protein